MATMSQHMELAAEFDPRSCRHLIDGQPYVLHCHHYAALYTQLAEDCGMLDGKRLLAEVAEDTFYQVLSGYFRKHGIESVPDRIAAAEDYFRMTGMGILKVLSAGPDYGEIEIPSSHLDEGWIKKWGRHNRPVNHLGRGFIASLFCAAFDRPPRSYSVTETVSIVCGAPCSRFEAVAE
jgi:hypothetical protein